MRIVAGLAGLLLLAGCNASPEAQAIQNQQDDAQCRQIGAKPGTDAMVNCRVALLQERNADRRDRRRRLLGAALLAGSAAPASPRVVNCQSVTTGVTTNARCF